MEKGDRFLPMPVGRERYDFFSSINPLVIQGSKVGQHPLVPGVRDELIPVVLQQAGKSCFALVKRRFGIDPFSAIPGQEVVANIHSHLRQLPRNVPQRRETLNLQFSRIARARFHLRQLIPAEEAQAKEDH